MATASHSAATPEGGGMFDDAERARAARPRADPPPARITPAVAVAALLGAALLGAAALTGWTFLRELAASRLVAAAGDVIDRGAGAAELERRLAGCGVRCPSRGRDAAAAAKLVLAGRTSGAARSRLLADAEAEQRRALAGEPLSAEGWGRLALIRSLADGGRLGPGALSALERSYEAAPFSRGASAWRIGFCLRRWSDITPSLRNRALDELAWLVRIDPPLADRLIRQASDPAGRLAIDLRLAPDAAPPPAGPTPPG